MNNIPYTNSQETLYRQKPDSGFLKTLSKQPLQDLTRLTASICHTPIACLCLQSSDKRWFTYQNGLDPIEIPNLHSFSAHTMLQPDLVIIHHPSDVSFPGFPFYAGIPLRHHQGETLGVLSILDRSPKSFPPSQQERLRAMSRAVLAQLALEDCTYQQADLQARLSDLEATVDEQSRLIELDQDIGRILNSPYQFQPLLQGCAETLVHHVNAAFVRIWTMNPGDSILELQASAGLYTNLQGRHHRIPLGQFKIGKIAADRTPLFTNSVIGDPHIHDQDWAKREGMVAFAGYPLLRGEEVLGVLALFAQHPLSDHTLNMLATVADRLTVAVECHQQTEALRDFSRRHEQILASAGEGIYGLDADGHTTFINPAGASLLGYTPEELLGTPFPASSQIHKAKEFPQMQRKDGTWIPVETTKTPIWQDQQIVGTVGTFRDMSERQRLTAELLQQTKLAEVARVLGDISHDTKNMLMPLLNGMDLLQQELHELFRLIGSQGSPQIQASRRFAQEIVDLLRNNFHRIQDRVKEIVDAVKGATTPPSFQPCHIPSLINEVFQTLHINAMKQGVSLNREGLDHLPAIPADQRLLFSAIYNLIDNAIPEVPSGGRITVQGTVDHQSQSLLLLVSDTGKGFPQELCATLFTQSPQSHKPGGTGLGIKIIKDAIEAHQGTILVKSQQGVGTTFTIRLPLTRTNHDSQEHTAHCHPTHSHKEKTHAYNFV